MNKKEKVMLLVAMLSLAIGFAAVATTLYINGTANLVKNDSDFDIYYSKAEVNGEVDNTVITGDKEITFTKDFDTVGDKYTLKYYITNGSKNYDAKVTMNCTSGNDYVSVNNNWVNNTIISATETKNGTLTIEMIKSYIGNDTLKLNVTCTINASATERTEAGTGTPESKLDTLCRSPFKKGDYISMTPDATEYVVTKSMTGYSSDQTINPSELNIWRVLNINDDCTVDAISNDVSSSNIYFKGYTGYMKSIGTLNEIASQYSKEGFVTETRNFGFNGQTEYITDTTKLYSSTAPWITNTPSLTTIEEERLGRGDMFYKKDFNTIMEVFGDTYAKISGTSTNGYYWISSRYYNYSSETLWMFMLTSTDGSGRSVGSTPIQVYTNGGRPSYEHAAHIRPIITLSSAVNVSSGDGTSAENAYSLSN